MTNHKAEGRNRRQRGTTIVEAAIVLTLLMLVTLGAIEYGWMFVNLQRFKNAARQGARVAAASGATDADGEQKITDLLGTLPIPPDVITDVATGTVTATVVVDSSTVSLVNWSLLPMPAQLKAVVTMAKEAQ
jgi:Flp pilus assembly protein TadG